MPALGLRQLITCNFLAHTPTASHVHKTQNSEIQLKRLVQVGRGLSHSRFQIPQGPTTQHVTGRAGNLKIFLVKIGCLYEPDL